MLNLETNLARQWMRKCEKCGNVQWAKKPENVTDSYRNAKCRKCGSMGLDFGSYRDVRVAAKSAPTA
jgi:hypothetical protein